MFRVVQKLYANMLIFSVLGTLTLSTACVPPKKTNDNKQTQDTSREQLDGLTNNKDDEIKSLKEKIEALKHEISDCQENCVGEALKTNMQKVLSDLSALNTQSSLLQKSLVAICSQEGEISEAALKKHQDLVSDVLKRIKSLESVISQLKGSDAEMARDIQADLSGIRDFILHLLNTYPCNAQVKHLPEPTRRPHPTEKNDRQPSGPADQTGPIGIEARDPNTGRPLNGEVLLYLKGQENVEAVESFQLDKGNSTMDVSRLTPGEYILVLPASEGLDTVSLPLTIGEGGTHNARGICRLVPHITQIQDNCEDGGALSGKVRDATNENALKNVNVAIVSVDEKQNPQPLKTDASGTFSGPKLAPGRWQVTVHSDGYSPFEKQIAVCDEDISLDDIFLSPLMDSENSLRTVLTWMEDKNEPDTVRDIDLYLETPNDGRIFYNRKGTTSDPAYLDRDDTNWGGPETITIKTIKNGTYRLWVQNYSNHSSTTALGNSRAKVTIHYKGKTQVVNVLPGSGTKFEIFKMTDGKLDITGAYFN